MVQSRPNLVKLSSTAEQTLSQSLLVFAIVFCENVDQL